MKNKRKQMMISSLIMLIVAAMALTTTTLAWFTTGSTGKITDFEFKAQDASGIQFSVDAENWKSVLSKEDIATQVDKDFETADTAQYESIFTTQVATFSPLSATNTLTAGKLNLFKTVADGEKLKADAVGSDKTYYVFNVYVNNLSGDAKDLKLTNFTVTTGDAETKNTELATRIAFIDQGCVSKTSAAAQTVKANVLKLAGGTTAKILEPNATEHTGFAKTYLLTSEQTSAKLDYYGVQEAGSYAVVNNFISPVADKVVPVTTFEDKTTVVASLAGDSITKMTIYVWIEGQDIDCNNDVASGKVKINLDFEASSNYTVTYKANLPEGVTALSGGTVPTDSTSYKADANVTVKFPDPAMTVTGYTFKGWAIDGNATTPDYTAGGTTAFQIKGSTTLYAVWEAVD